MFSLAWGEKVHVWPVGIDTDAWHPEASVSKDVDVLVYDKIRWRRDRLVPDLLERIRARLRSMGLAHEVLRYGSYREADFKALVHRSRSMVYLCEHETQGIALQQVLSCNVPVLVWDRRGCWQDPAYFPDRVRFQPVTTVPYWDERCGSTFADFGEFEDRIDAFWSAARCGSFAGRSYILQNLTLDKAATNYVDIIRRIAACRQEA